MNEFQEPNQSKVGEAILDQLRRLNEHQRDILSAIKASTEKKRDFWDILPAATGFLASVGIGIVAALFTHAYNEQQITLTRLDTLQKFVDDVTSPDLHKQEVSLSIIRSLRDTEFETEIAADIGSPGAVTRLAQIAVTGTGQDRAYAIEALTEINPSITIPELAKIAVTGPKQDRAIGIQTINYLNPRGVDELATVATTGSAVNRSLATKAIDGSQTRGVDVSELQKVIDWKAVAQDRIVFAIARHTQGDKLTDEKFGSNWAGMKDAGLIRGAYHVFVGGQDPIAQANAFLADLPLEPNDLPPILDCEEASLGSMNDASLAADLSHFLDLVQKRTGRVPIVYAYPSFFAQHPAVSKALNGYPVWVASYGAPKPPDLPGWDHWTFWQYSDSGKVDGIPNQVDLNIFDGSIDDLRSFVARK